MTDSQLNLLKDKINELENELKRTKKKSDKKIDRINSDLFKLKNDNESMNKIINKLKQHMSVLQQSTLQVILFFITDNF